VTVGAIEVGVRPARPGDGAGPVRVQTGAGRQASLDPDRSRVLGEDGHRERLERGPAVPARDLHRVAAEVGGGVVASAPVEAQFRGREVGARPVKAFPGWRGRRGAAPALPDAEPESALPSACLRERAGHHRRSRRRFEAR
jgi:hypothetical protein